MKMHLCFDCNQIKPKNLMWYNRSLSAEFRSIEYICNDCGVDKNGEKRKWNVEKGDWE